MERQRVTVQEAARILGVKEPAIRKRIKRGTLQGEKVGDRVFVYLDTERSVGQSTGYSEERSTERHQERDELVEELRDRIASLERQLEQHRDADREHRRLLAAAMERIPSQLEAPRDEQESPSEAAPRSDEGVGTQEPERPFWRRWFGG